MARRVGIVSDNSSLFVALSLRGEGLEFTRATDVSSLGSHDVAVLDVPEGHDAQALAADVPVGPVVVMLADDDTPVEGATVVPRPYAVGELLDLLRTISLTAPVPEHPPIVTTEVLFTNSQPPAKAPRSDVGSHEPVDTPGVPDPILLDGSVDEPLIVLDDDPEPAPEAPPAPDAAPAVAAEPAAPLFEDSERFQERKPVTTGPEAHSIATAQRTAVQAGPVATLTDDVLDVVDLESDDPIVHVRQLAHALTQALGQADFLTSIGVLADRLATSLAREHEADHVALWHRAQDSYVILGAAGLTSVARHDIVAADHAAIVATRAQGGLLVEDPTHRTAHTRTLPGARSPRYGCVILDQDAVPVHLVTISAQEMDYDRLIAISDVLLEATAAWDAIVTVERLRSTLGMA